MGEYAEMVIEGVLCQECHGVVDGDEAGFPRTCDECEGR